MDELRNATQRQWLHIRIVLTPLETLAGNDKSGSDFKLRGGTMHRAPCRVIAVSDVRQVVVSADPSEGAILLFEVPGEANLELKIPAIAFAKLEGLLAKASATQAKLNRPQ